MSKLEVLQQRTCKELREQAKVLEISRRWEMTKGELIEAILKAEEAKFSNVKAEAKSAIDEVGVDNQEGVEVEEKTEKEFTNTEVEVDMGQKMHYIENIDIGTLVAFRLSNGKVKSAKVVRKSTKNRKLKLETDYGAEYIVSFEDIIWVRTGKRWPKGVYRLLKGLGDNNGKERSV